MESIFLRKGVCAICHAIIRREWVGEDLALGARCRNCRTTKVFGTEHVSIHCESDELYDPIFGRHELAFDWRGSRLLINDRLATIIATSDGCGYVRFAGEPVRSVGTRVDGLGYDDLRRIHEAQGGIVSPPPLAMPVHEMSKASLLDKPILPVVVDFDTQGKVESAWVDQQEGEPLFADDAPALPMLKMFHAFANAYVRWKFRLFYVQVCEGGFGCERFRVRNAMQSHVGVTVSDYSPNVGLGGLWLSRLIKVSGQLHWDRRQRPRVSAKFADINTVMLTWALVMKTLLRHD